MLRADTVFIARNDTACGQHGRAAQWVSMREAYMRTLAVCFDMQNPQDTLACHNPQRAIFYLHESQFVRHLSYGSNVSWRIIMSCHSYVLMDLLCMRRLTR